MVRFEAPVPERSVNDVIAEADIFDLPLHQGGLYRWVMSPSKLFDYMTAARPVVTAVDAAVNPVLEADAGLALPAADAVAVAEATKTLLAPSPEEHWAMGLRERRDVETPHDMGRLAERFEACLQSAIRGGGSKPPSSPRPARLGRLEHAYHPRTRARRPLWNLLIQV